MNSLHQHSRLWRRMRPVAGGLALALIVAGTPGLGCDGDAATVFRQTATGAVGSGVKTIVNGVLDGVIAAIEQAGDGDQDDGSGGQ